MRPARFQILVATVALLAGPGLAQQSPPQRNPINDNELNLLLTAAAGTTCELANNKVAYDLSVQSSSSSVVAIIGQIFGGKIASISTALTPQQVFGVVSTEVALRTNAFCPKVVPEETKKQLAEIIKNRQSSTQK